MTKFQDKCKELSESGISGGVNTMTLKIAKQEKSCKTCYFHESSQITNHTHTETENRVEIKTDKHACKYGRGGGRILKGCFKACDKWLYKDTAPEHPLERRVARLERKIDRMRL